MSTLQKIADIEAEMDRTQKNKATNNHLGILKAKLAKLKRELITPSGGKGGGAAAEGFDVSKSGDARIGLIGFPSVGKSTLLTKLTDAKSECASYDFTTLTCIPGSFLYKGCKIQMLDLPGIIEGARDGKGRGKQVIGVARTCSMVLVVMDAVKSIYSKKLVEKELEGFGIRLNKRIPDIILKRKEKGGIIIISPEPMKKMDNEMVLSICREYKISNAEITLRGDPSVDELIDVIEGNRVYIPCLYVLNKIDKLTITELNIIDKMPHFVPISGYHEWNLDDLLEEIWTHLDMIRIFTKPRGQIPDYDAPVVMPRTKNSIEEFCRRIHKSLIRQFKYALVWGTSVKHNPQKVGKSHRLHDQDVVQIIKKR